MQKFALILFILARSFAAHTQVVFKTILKAGPVVAGESFAVQYILEDVENGNDFSPPVFKNFRFVSGPYTYEGSAFGANGPLKMKNIVYTLEAIEPGRFIIGGASITVGDKVMKSDDVKLEVISRAEAVKRGLQAGNARQTAMYLRPGEDAYKKIRTNLFLKVLVDKRTCFVGEPVTATFKLYSCLASRSDIVKNPGFYGFTVQDMVNLKDNESVVEAINGTRFDVHTIRKVQLYPLQAGVFNIDPIEVSNEVRFSKSAVRKETEQEIVEGIFPESDEPVMVNEEKYETRMSTPAVAITVRPLPLKSRPPDFTGATGEFQVSATMSKKEIARNEEGKLVITVSGKGNFTQLPPPVIKWPAGIEGFEPQVTDSLEHTQSPLKGKRIFRFTFVSARPGSYVIPETQFSFFNPDSGSYKTVTTAPLPVTIDTKEKKTQTFSEVPKKPQRTKGIGGPFILAAVLLFILTGGWLLWSRKKTGTDAGPVLTKTATPTITEILQPATVAVMADDQLFYTLLRDAIWKFAVLHFGFTASGMSRRQLLRAMQQRKVDENHQAVLLDVLQQCETGIFTGVAMNADKKEMLVKTKEALAAMV